VIAGKSRDGAIIGGFTFSCKKAARNLTFVTVIGNAFATEAAFFTGIGAGAMF